MTKQADYGVLKPAADKCRAIHPKYPDVVCWLAAGHLGKHKDLTRYNALWAPTEDEKFQEAPTRNEH